jgi:hypothetical protein
MAFPNITDDRIDTDSPIDVALMTDLRDQPLMIASGEAGAPRIQLEAFEELAAGDEVRRRYDALIVLASNDPSFLALSVPVMQVGGVRVYADGRRTGGTPNANLAIRRIRGGVTTLLASLETASAAFVTLSADISVAPGDLVELVAGASTSGVLQEWQNVRLCVAPGVRLWPAGDGSEIENP